MGFTVARPADLTIPSNAPNLNGPISQDLLGMAVVTYSEYTTHKRHHIFKLEGLPWLFADTVRAQRSRGRVAGP